MKLNPAAARVTVTLHRTPTGTLIADLEISLDRQGTDGLASELNEVATGIACVLKRILFDGNEALTKLTTPSTHTF